MSLSPVFIKKGNDNRPYINVRINNNNVLGLIDTGSNASIFGSLGLGIINYLGKPLIRDSQLKITTADGSPQELLGYIDVDISVNNICKEVRVLVIPSVEHKLILGVDFLKKFEISLDLANGSYKMNDVSISVVNAVQPLESLSSNEKSQLHEVMKLFISIAPKNRLGRTHLLSHSIELIDKKPFKQRQYPLSPVMQKHLNSEVDKMLKLGLIQPSTSPYCSPLWLVKKSDDTFRVCFDGRKLNSKTSRDSYPLPLIENTLNKIRDARFLSTIDLKQAFFQVPLETESRPMTAFAVHGRGLFEFCVMPFGLSCSSQTMCRLMDQVIGPELEPYCEYYIDDIIVATGTFEKHIEILKKVYERLKNAGLTINFEKSQFCRSSLKFLGFLVDQFGLRTDPQKVSAVVDYPTPKNTTQIRRLLGLVSYYRRFLKNFSSLCSPITDLLHGRKKGQSITWTPEADEAFQKIKQCLTTAPVLASPDYSKPFIIHCDAADSGIGAALFQVEDGLEHPVAYYSKTLNKCQRKWTTTEKELFAVVSAVEHFRGYVEGSKFKIITDHASLIWLCNLSNPSPKLARWLVKLGQYNYDIEHRKGALNVVADALSRSNVDVAMVSISDFVHDNWYKDMLVKVSDSPELYPSFLVKDNTLYKHVLTKLPLVSNISDWKIVVPTANRQAILKSSHDDETAGHFGVFKTLAKVSELYYWPNMRKSVYKYVRKCQTCAANKPSNLPQAGLMGAYRDINFPYQLLSADLIGPYPRSKNGCQYVLVVVDWFTKYVHVNPIAKATTRSIIKFLENVVFLNFGVPQIFACDNGSQFTSKEFEQFIKSYEIQKVWYNARYHPQVNHTERANKVVISTIRCFINENHKDWDKNIYKIAHAINSARHDVTGYSPNFLNFCRNIPIKGDFYGKIADNANNITTIGDKLYRANDAQEVPKIYDDVRRKLKNAYLKNSHNYNLRRRSQVFKLGDKVWKRNYVLSKAISDFSAKLAPRYIPCTVTKVISPLVYELTAEDGNKLGRWHTKDLKPNHTDLDSDDSLEPDASDNEL